MEVVDSRGWIPREEVSSMLRRRRLAGNTMVSNMEEDTTEITIERLYPRKEADTKLTPAEITTTVRRTITRHLRIISHILPIRCTICRRSMMLLHLLALALPPSAEGMIRRRCLIVLKANMRFLRRLHRMAVAVDIPV